MKMSFLNFWSSEVLLNKYMCYLKSFEAIATTVVRHIIGSFMISIANTRHLKDLTDDSKPLRASSQPVRHSPLLRETAAIRDDILILSPPHLTMAKQLLTKTLASCHHGTTDKKV